MDYVRVQVLVLVGGRAGGNRSTGSGIHSDGSGIAIDSTLHYYTYRQP